MFWNFATIALFSAGSYLVPPYFGGLLNLISSDPIVRTEQRIIFEELWRPVQSDSLRFFGGESNVTPYRVHGGVGPASSSP